MEYIKKCDGEVNQCEHRRPNDSITRFVIGQYTIDESEELYTNHLVNQLTMEGLEIPPNLVQSGVFQDTANALQMLSDIFASSPQRMWVHQRVQNVELNTLNFQTFNDLLSGLFQVSEHIRGNM